FELPGLWLNSEELHALLATQQLLSRSAGGMLSSALAPLQQRIDKLLDEHAHAKHGAGKQGVATRWPVERVRVIPHRTRRMDEHAFRAVGSEVTDGRHRTLEYVR